MSSRSVRCPCCCSTYAATSSPYYDRLFLDIVNMTILVAFTVDYVVEILLTRNRSQYLRHEWISPLLIVSQALALVPTLAEFGVLRVLRGARACR